MSEVLIAEVLADDVDGISQVRELFVEYAEWLTSFITASTIPSEIASLPEPYVRPSGRLFLARERGGAVCGCIGVRRHNDTECEVKRLFVRDCCRGSGAGRALLESALEAAVEIGYEAALISTVPAEMPVAVSMYEQVGFVDAEQFEDKTHASLGLRYLRLDLRAWQSGRQ